MARPAAVLDILVNAQTGKASAELKKFERNLKSTERQASDTDTQIVKSDKNVRSFGGSVGDANQRVLGLKNAVGLVKFPAFIAGAGAAAQAVGALGAGAVGLTSALAPLSGLLAAYPALLGAIGQAAGVKALAGFDKLGGAVGGLNEKLDETTAEFKALSPEAQKFARSLNQAKGPVRDLQAAVQKPLFKGLNEGIDAAMQNFPSLQKVLKGTAGEMGRLAKEAGELVGSKGFGKDFESIGKNNTQLLGRLGDAGLNFANALRHVMVAAEPLIDFLGKGVVKFSEWVEAESKAGRESGRLAEFFERTQKVVRQLVSIGGSLASAFMDIGRAARPLGESILKTLVQQARALSEWTSSNQGTLKAYFEDAKGPLAEAGKLVKDIVAGFFDLSNQSGLAGFISQIRKDLLPAVLEMTEATTKQFGPVLIDTLVQLTKLLTNFIGSSGTLTLFVRGVGQAAEVLNRLFEAIPALAHVASSALAGFSILKLLGLSSIGPIFTKAGATAGTSFATGMQMTAGQSFFGGAGGTGAKGSWAKNLAAGAATLGKRLLGVNLALGVVAGFSSEAPTITGKLQDAVSSMTLGLVPSFEESSAKLAETFTRGLKKGMTIEPPKTTEQTGAGGRFGAVGGGGVGVGESQLKALIPLLSTTRTSFANAEKATKQWRQELARTKDEFTPADYRARLNAVNELYDGFKRSKEATRQFEENVFALKNSLHHSITDIRKDSEKNLRELARSMDLRSAEGKDAVVKNYEATEDAIKNSLNAGLISEKKALRELRRILEKELRTYGIKDVGAMISRMESPQYGSGEGGKQRGGVVAQLAGGGMVPGHGSGDKVPLHIGGRMAAMVEPGEYVSVANKKATQALMQANAAVPRFQGGGMVDPAGPGTGVVNSAIAGVVGDWSQRYDAAINYGYDPGDNHQSPGHNVTGTATDTGPAGGWVGRSLELFEQGLRFLIGKVPQILYGTAGIGDPYPGHGRGNHAHIEWGMSPNIRGMGGGTVASGASVDLPRWEGNNPYGVLVAEAVNKVAAGAENQVNKKLASMGAGASGATGRIDGGFANIAGQGAELMQNISQQKGWNFNDWWSIDAIESSHGSNLVNPSSTARLRGQFLDFNWGKYGPGSDPGPAPGTNPALWPPMDEQIRSMAAYIAERYGNPSEAWAWHQAHNWYKKGGVVLSGDSLGEGMRDNAGFPSGWALDVVGGRSSTAGAAKVAGLVDKYDPLALVFEAGSNDGGSGGPMKGALKKVGKAVGDDIGLALMNTSNNPAANRVIEGFGRMDALADWAAIAGDYGTGVHPPPKGYVAMRDIVKAAAKKAKEARKGPGAAGGSDDRDRDRDEPADPTESPWAQAFIKNYVPPKIKEHITAHNEAIADLDTRIMLADFMHGFASSEAGSSRGPFETAVELALNEALLTNLLGLEKWLEKGIKDKRTAPKARRDLERGLAELQGDADSVGRILETQALIDELKFVEPADLTEAQEFSNEYLMELLRNANQRTAVSEAQTRVFQGTPMLGAFAGGFADGGYIPQGQWGVVGERGPEVVSGPNTVTPVADAAAPSVVVNVAPGMEWLKQFISVEVVNTTRQQARGRPLGGARGM